MALFNLIETKCSDAGGYGEAYEPCITKLSLAFESGRRLNFSPYMDVFDFELVNPDGNVAEISFAEVLRCLK